MRLSLWVAAVAVGMLVISAIAAPSEPVAGAPGRALCVGHVHTVPSHVKIGGAFTIFGDHFTCKTPNNLLYHAAVILYRPHIGFTIFTAAVNQNGSYQVHTHMPKVLSSEAVLSGGKDVTVTTRPGTYYLTVRLSDVYLPPPTQSSAHLTVTG